jgi:hypothetical protein
MAGQGRRRGAPGATTLTTDWQTAIYELFMAKVKYSYLIDKHRHKL